MIPLAPCPWQFPGEVHEVSMRHDKRETAETWWVACSCRCAGPNRDSEDRAALTWNRWISGPYGDDANILRVDLGMRGAPTEHHLRVDMTRVKRPAVIIVRVSEGAITLDGMHRDSRSDYDRTVMAVAALMGPEWTGFIGQDDYGNLHWGTFEPRLDPDGWVDYGDGARLLMPDEFNIPKCPGDRMSRIRRIENGRIIAWERKEV